MSATIISKAQMASTVDSSMPNVYFVICSDDGYIYKYDKSNTVDSTTGRYRKYTSPGNSSIIDTANEIMNNYSNPETIIFSDKELNDLGDVTVSSPSNGQVLTYNSTTDKWENGAGGGTGGSGGHTIEDDSGTALTQRETMQFGEGFITEDDDTNEKTVISPDVMQSGDIDDVINPLPSVSHGNANPTGTIIHFMGNYAPDGYLACDGSTKNIADYPRLANFFLVQFGSINKFGGNGTTTFAVPNLNGQFLRGTGTNSDTSQGSGANVGERQKSTELPESAVNSDATAIFLRANSANSGYYGGNYKDSTFKRASGTLKNAQATTTANTTAGTTDTYTIRPTNTSVLLCIKD